MDDDWWGVGGGESDGCEMGVVGRDSEAVALVGADEVVGGVWVVLWEREGRDGGVGFEGEALFGVVCDGGADVGEGYVEGLEAGPFELWGSVNQE
jgi:hypothetical protein